MRASGFPSGWWVVGGVGWFVGGCGGWRLRLGLGVWVRGLDGGGWRAVEFGAGVFTFLWGPIVGAGCSEVHTHPSITVHILKHIYTRTDPWPPA